VKSTFSNNFCPDANVRKGVFFFEITEHKKIKAVKNDTTEIPENITNL